ncbi:hypothetical protein METBIDRAFT_222858 [Metschnikowia bicuspidata var. bicuspidata NRRL YB-4993]|uniref:Uncharacterized protein n=1 Tax=Metschnikowia bicuspidata var. bicuspidata NRRL YB-4993 TaxID=869754 RepID=A0A1A0H5U1_9ASCO|nr:hypothetical protein METBIDRAFT_222858 [Metschnikowia bicuspidata var. bicuspidata NRRL YB-4993]OBA19401.1 hypothetical protein METBIDRAFT_222858 [Metschnikowia bicuspidata var. bicuspidata NRRL YB-4993]
MDRSARRSGIFHRELSDYPPPVDLEENTNFFFAKMVYKELISVTGLFGTAATYLMLQEKKTELDTLSSKFRQDIKNLEKELKEITEKSQEQKKADLESHGKALAEKDAIALNIDAEKAKLSLENDTLTGKVQKLSSEVTDLSKERSELSAKLAEGIKKAEALKKEVALAEAKAEECKQNYEFRYNTELSKVVAEKDIKISQLEKSAKELQEFIEKLKREFDSALQKTEEELKSFKAIAEEKIKDYELLVEKSIEKDNKIQSLEDLVETGKSDINALEAKCDERDGKIETLENEVNDKVKEIV